MRIIFSFILIIKLSLGLAQEANANFALASRLSQYSDYKDEWRKEYKDNREGFARYNPVNYLSKGVLFFYQRIISRQTGSECVYHLSCSEYTKYQIKKRGGIMGILLGFHQFQSCNPKALLNYPDHKVNYFGKINNRD